MSDSSIRLSLSATGLQRLERVNHEHDFAFIVGTERYPCPSFVAEFLSPRITSLRSQDITIDEFSIATEDPSHHFESLISVGFGKEVSLSGNDLSFIRSVCGELWNSELLETTLKREEGEMTVEELKARLEFVSGVDGSCGYDISVIASHFHEFSVSDFDHLSGSILELILKDEALVVRDEDSVFDVIYRRASSDNSYFRLLEFVRFEFVSVDCMDRALEFISGSFESFTFGIWSSLGRRLRLPITAASPGSRLVQGVFDPPIDSKIISTIPDIFGLSRPQRLELLYRGSRDGFQASDFHGRCNNHPITITLISSTNDCIFGGHTPVAWSSQNGYGQDPSLKSFIFTLKNPHNLSPRIFKQKQAEYAIYNYSLWGPIFAGHQDLAVCGQCHSVNSSYSNVGNGYINDTGIPGNQVLSGAQNFTVAEIEVFEVIWRVRFVTKSQPHFTMC
jgi:hypothetical protein